MNAYLTRLGIRSEVQEWLEPHTYTDDVGNLCFAYGEDSEIYGLAFHRVPLSGCWTAGPEHARQVIISSSAMEVIAWLNCNYTPQIEHFFFVAGDYRRLLRHKKYSFLFGNDLLGRIHDLKAATMLTGHPAEISVITETVQITFRSKRYAIPVEKFSLHAFELLSGFRFGGKTLKPNRHNSWLEQLLNH
jgi:hypothetical protein